LPYAAFAALVRRTSGKIQQGGKAMARTVRNPKIDTRTARSRLATRSEPYWTVISAGCALGYRRGAKGGTWIAKFRDEHGTRRLEALGAADDARDADGQTVFDFRQAQAKARDWFQEKAREAAGDFVPLGHPYTVADAIVDYLADYKRRSGKATDRTEAAARAWIVPELGPLPLDKLTKGRIQRWHQKLAETPPRLRTKIGEAQKHREADASLEGVRRRRSTANRVLTILKAALNHAHHEGRCASDDGWRTVRAFREVDAARLRYLSDYELRRLTNACLSDFRPLVTGALLTGCRYGELTKMTVDDFNPDAATVQVRISKAGKPRHVALTQEGSAFFVGLAAGRPSAARLFLRSNGRPWAKSEQQRPLAAACTKANIEPPANFHTLRHTYASRLAMRGVPLAVIAAQLGHADTRMVEKHYGHLAPNYIADTVRAAFGTLGIVEPSNVVPISGSRQRAIAEIGDKH
jgi:integrase